MQYFFILGNNPTLSVAEIQSLINTRFIKNEAEIIKLSSDFLILETKEKLDCQKLQEKLGGTIKIGEIISRINTNVITNNTNIIREICDRLVKIRESSRKIYFGFSFYGNKQKDTKLSPQIKEWAMEIKKQLKGKGISSRWVISKEKTLSSVIVIKNKLLTQGAEFCFFLGANITYVGKTESCQAFEDYSERDFGRPARKIEEGMMPPKLAKIMINLAQAPENSVILDPFCGSGTIIQEAILMGYQNVIGTDISEEAVKSSQENIKWFLENSKSQIPNVKQISNLKFQIFQCDVRSLSQKIAENSIDAIITEPYLGPIKIHNSQFMIHNSIPELSNLYLKAFSEFKKVLKKDGRVVIIFPVFRYHFPNSREFGSNHLSEKILDEIRKIGFETVNPIPENLRKNPVIKITARDSIIYSRPNQQVLREIFVFIRSS